MYSEIRAVIDPRSTVKQHILQHLEDFVSIHTRWIEAGRGGEVWVGARYGKQVPLSDSRVQLYVHPRTGILSRNRQYKSWVDKRRESQAVEQQQVRERRRVVSDFIQLLRLDDLWYQVELGLLPAPRALPRGAADKSKAKLAHDYLWDCVENRLVSLEARSPEGQRSAQARRHLYGDARLYAKSKRQLCAKELKKHSIANKALSGLIRFWRGLCHRIGAGRTIFPMFGAGQRRPARRFSIVRHYVRKQGLLPR